MHKLALWARYPLPRPTVIYAIYWTVCAIFVGMLLSPGGAPQTPAQIDHSTHFTHDHSMFHGLFEIAAENAPLVTLHVQKDALSGWNVEVQTEGFEFRPNGVNSEPILGEGHGHIYVNGEKLARLYSPHFHLADLPPGTNEIRVTLNAHDHSAFTVNGEEISASARVFQPMPQSPTR
ncbi:hypothetical protein [Shimia sp. MIT910701]|jgi:hypothetical protein|uniref:hypothetical protein n=1 Tax=Shimia sp. MIT910701 TaxID=3096987 RepID=UPI00399A1A82